MSSLLPLHAAHPALAQAYPVAGLLRGPTRVQPLAGTRDCWLKRDDLTAADYGGNKIRKLDFLLADAQRRGKKTLVAFGYAGSNFVAATAWHGRKLGLRTIGCLLPQANAGYVADNLSVSLAAGAELIARPKKFPLVRAAAAASLKAWRRDSAWPLWIPPGGSNALGALGYVNAAYELKAQIDARAVPAPQAIYLPISSMGSVAGLVAGLALAGLDVQI
ncbi:MAG TPA: pyridoxal-phosphate dependent enzyme, partial [Nevskiaceae bacterium]|nr:pyridoxal-phosphate dependent enzyme [Nevskiaceae bacterium]